jgi:hypothetical protein
MTMRRLTSENMDNFLNGEYMSVNANSKVSESPIRVLFDVPLVDVVMLVSVLLANIPINKTAIA